MCVLVFSSMVDPKVKQAKKTVQISKEAHTSLIEYCKRLGLKINAFVEKLIITHTK